VKDKQVKMGQMALAGDMLMDTEKKLLEEVQLLKRQNSVLMKENELLKQENDKYIQNKKNQGFSLLENEN